MIGTSIAVQPAKPPIYQVWSPPTGGTRNTVNDRPPHNSIDRRMPATQCVFSNCVFQPAAAGREPDLLLRSRRECDKMRRPEWNRPMIGRHGRIDHTNLPGRDGTDSVGKGELALHVPGRPHPALPPPPARSRPWRSPSAASSVG